MTTKCEQKVAWWEPQRQAEPDRPVEATVSLEFRPEGVSVLLTCWEAQALAAALRVAVLGAQAPHLQGVRGTGKSVQTGERRVRLTLPDSSTVEARQDGVITVWLPALDRSLDFSDDEARGLATLLEMGVEQLTKTQNSRNVEQTCSLYDPQKRRRRST